MAVLVLLVGVVWGLGLLATSEAIFSKVFSMDTYENGTKKCALDLPSVVEYDSSAVRCGVSCVVQQTCIHFNYFRETLRCELFSFTPKFHNAVDGCEGFTILAPYVSPLNTSQLVGTDVVLNCCRSTQWVRWIFLKPGSTTPDIIVEHCQVLTAFEATYAIDKTSLGCNLLIRNATVDHSGTYGCQDELSSDDRATAELNIQVAECSDNSSSGVIAVGDHLKLTCSFAVNKGDGATPYFQWLDYTGTPVTNASIQLINNILTTYILLPAYFPSIREFKFTTYASDGSSYNYSWTSNEVEVWPTAMCPPGFQYLSAADGCYQFLLRSLTWNEASGVCRQLHSNSYLAMITSPTEQNAVATFLHEELNLHPTGGICLNPWNHTYGNFIWIGGQTLTLNICQPFVWKPSVGNTVALNYTNWIPGNPDCKSTGEHCLHIWENRDYAWNDYPCGMAFCALCEYGPWY